MRTSPVVLFAAGPVTVLHAKLESAGLGHRLDLRPDLGNVGHRIVRDRKRSGAAR
ncbi:hypothetical protein ACIQZB_20920 [Streptomyces sp. NPDC097727]|uniref:hypothetical protein n=1 Tax=Streptomyces sp. NPDC097727 TaxID=3366092 RepID=UPI0038049E77